MVSAVKCVNLAIHRPVPLGLIMHYMFIKIKNFLKSKPISTNEIIRRGEATRILDPASLIFSSEAPNIPS